VIDPLIDGGYRVHRNVGDSGRDILRIGTRRKIEINEGLRKSTVRYLKDVRVLDACDAGWDELGRE